MKSDTTKYSELAWDVLKCKRCEGNKCKELGISYEKIDYHNLPLIVGRNYSKSKKRVCIIAQNPGESTKQSIDEEQTHLQKFYRSEKNKDYEAFCEFMVKERFSGVKKWKLFDNFHVLTNLDILPSQIAFTNVVKCRTTDNNGLGQPLIRKCSYHLENEIKALEPKFVITLGAPARDEIKRLPKDKKVNVFSIPHTSRTWGQPIKEFGWSIKNGKWDFNGNKKYNNTYRCDLENILKEIGERIKA